MSSTVEQDGNDEFASEFNKTMHMLVVYIRSTVL